MSMISDLMVSHLFLFNKMYRDKMTPHLNSAFFDDPNLDTLIGSLLERVNVDINDFPKSVKGYLYRNPLNEDSEVIKEKMELIDVDIEAIREIEPNELLSDVKIWLKTKSFTHYIKEGYNEVTQKGDVNYTLFADKINSIDTISFEDNADCNMLDVRNNLRIISESSPRIDMGNKYWNEITNGGFEVGTFNVVMGRVGVGKSRVLLNIAWNYMQHKDNIVLYISLEMSIKNMLVRLYAIMFGMTTNEVERLSKNDTDKLYDDFISTCEMRGRRLGNIYFKRYPATATSTSDYKALLQNLKNRGIVPNVIIVDYLGISASSNKNGATDSHGKGAEIAVQYRDFFAEAEVVGFTGVQTFQGRIKKDFELTVGDEGGSQGIGATADAQLIIMEDKIHAKMKQQVIKFAKSRDNSTGYSLVVKTSDYYSLTPMAIKKPQDQLDNPEYKEDVADKNKTTDVTSTRNKSRLKSLKNKRR